jgi:eukaryotic-like serine/threonine-protein kinase
MRALNLLAKELGRFLRGEPIQARPISRLRGLWRWCRRHPVRAGLSAALITVGMLGATGVLWQWRQAEAARQLALAEQERSQRAERGALQELRTSCLAQARANRWSARPGRRFDSMAALGKAAAIRPSLELRNEAIDCLALPDVQTLRQWTLRPGYGFDFDFRLERYARADADGSIRIYRVADGAELLRLPRRGQAPGHLPAIQS